MAKLTDWLDGFKVSPVPRHDKFPALVKPASFVERPKSICVQCPQVNKAKHESYGCGKITDYLPAGQRPDIRAFMTLPYLLHRLSADIFPPYGAQSGFMFYGQQSVNFADQYVFNVVSVSGTNVVVEVETDIRAIYIYLIARGNWGTAGTSYIPMIGVPQANDIVKPSDSCIIAGKIMSNVVKVIVDANDVRRATIVCEHDMSGVVVDNRPDQTDEWIPTITLIRQAGDPQRWTRVVRPSILKCQKQVLTVAAADLPEDKKLSLPRRDGTQGRVADPEPGDEATGKPPTMQVWFKRVGVEELEDVTSEATSRFKKDSTGAGADELGAYHSFLCLGTKDHNNDDAYSDLIDETVESISVVYFAEVPDNYAGTDWCAVGSRSCVHAIRDESGSFYAMDDGEAHTSDGKEFYCEIRRTYEIVETNDGRYRIKWSKNVTSEKFTGDCSLAGICAGYSPKNKAVEGARSFTLHRTANQILKEMTIGHDFALVQYWPGYPFYYVKRVGRPTIHSMTSGVPAANPIDWSPSVSYLQSGPYFVGDFATTSTENGTEFLPKIGGAWDARTSFADLTFPNPPPDGFFASNISSWQTAKLDALRRAYDDATDPYHSLRNYEEDMSARVNRDVNSVTTFGRGVSQTSRIVAGNETFLLPKLSCADDTAGQEQDRGDCTFTWYDTDQVGPDNFPYRMLIKFKPLIATGKQAVGEIKSAVIETAAESAGIITLELKNQAERWSRLKNVDRGNTFNEIFTFNTGGKIFRPPDFLQIMSSETDDSSYGNIDDWVSIGDCAWIEHGTDDFKAHRFTVVGGGAYLGSAAENFGAGKTLVTFDIANGYFQIPDADLVTDSGQVGQAGSATATLASDALAADVELFFTADVPFVYDQVLVVDGTNELLRVTGTDYENKKLWVQRSPTPSALTAGTIIRSVSVYDTWSGVPFESMTSDTRPSDIPTGKFWYDANAARFYWSPADYQKNVQIGFTVVDGSGIAKKENTHLYYNHSIFELNVDGTTYGYCVLDTMKTAAEFDGSGTATKVFIENSAATIATSGTPSDSTVIRQLDSNSHVVLLFDRKHSGKAGRIEIDSDDDNAFALDAPALVPEFATGIGWGKKRAVAKLADENDWLKNDLGNLVGKTVHFERMTQILSHDTTISLEFTKYQEDDYHAASAADLLLDRGRGYLYGKKSVVDSLRAIDTQQFCIFLS